MATRLFRILRILFKLLAHQEAKKMLNLKKKEFLLVSLAIGKGGNNIKLAGLLTGYDIDVYREDDEVSEDVELKEFADEIDEWILDEFIKIGCDTARSVLNLDEEDLVKRTDLEAETIREVVSILKTELEA